MEFPWDWISNLNIQVTRWIFFSPPPIIGALCCVDDISLRIDLKLEYSSCRVNIFLLSTHYWFPLLCRWHFPRLQVKWFCIFWDTNMLLQCIQWEQLHFTAKLISRSQKSREAGREGLFLKVFLLYRGCSSRVEGRWKYWEYLGILRKKYCL